MNFVLFHYADYIPVRGEGPVYYLMDAGTAEMLADFDSRVFTDGTTEADLWDSATVLEETRDKRAVSMLKQNYKEVF